MSEISESSNDTLKRAITISVIFGLVNSCLQFGIPLLSMQIFDRVIPSSHLSTLFALAAIVCLTTSCSAVIEWSRASVLTRAGHRITWLFESLVERATLDHTDTGGLHNDLDTFRNYLAAPLFTALLDMPAAAISILLMYFIHPLLTAYAILAAVLLTAMGIFAQALIGPRKTKASEFELQANETVLCAKQNAGDLLSVGGRSQYLRRLANLRLKMLANQGMAQRTAAWLDALGRCVRSILQIGMLTLTATLTVTHEINPGAIIAGTMVFARAMAPIERLTTSWSVTRQSRDAWTRLKRAALSHTGQEAQIRFPKLAGTLSIQAATVFSRTTNRSSLFDVTFEAEAGHVYLIVGSEGSGKSVLSQVLGGAIRPDRGRVLLDGMGFAGFDDRDLAQHIGYLPQVPTFPWSGPVSDLICRFGEPNDQAVVQAALLAGIDDLIRQLPQGYQTHITAHDPCLSAGQTQRLALARSYYGDPRVIVLDEPTSRLDESGEVLVADAVKYFKANGSTIIVVSRSQRFVNLCDRLLLIDDGRLKLISDGSQWRQGSAIRSVG